MNGLVPKIRRIFRGSTMGPRADCFRCTQHNTWKSGGGLTLREKGIHILRQSRTVLQKNNKYHSSAKNSLATLCIFASRYAAPSLAILSSIVNAEAVV